MKTNIETLEQAIETGCAIKAVYYANGEVVKIVEFFGGGKVSVEFQDGTEELIDRADLIDFTWN